MGSPMPMIGLAICVALGSFFGGLVTWIHYIVGFSTDVTGRQWHFTRVASRTTCLPMPQQQRPEPRVRQMARLPVLNFRKSRSRQTRTSK